MNAQRKYVFFTDRDLGKRFPGILKQAGINVERHIDHFPDDAKDTVWLAEVGKHGWYALTHDRRIRHNSSEITVVEKFGVGLFVIVGKAPFAELAQNFVLTLPKITRFIDKNPCPFIAKVYRPDKTKGKTKLKPRGNVRMWVSFR